MLARTDRIGDVMQTLPAIEAAAKAIGRPVSVLCQEATAPLLKNNPFVDEIIALSSRAKFKKSAGLILRFQFDALLVMVNDALIQGLIPHLHSIPVRMGPLSKPKMLFHYNYPVLQKRSKCRLNEAEYNLELVAALTRQEVRAKRPQLYFKEEEVGRFAEKLGDLLPQLQREAGYAILHSGMSGSALNWPFAAYCELATSLVQSGRQLVLTGMGPQEAERNQTLAAMNPQLIWNLTDQLTLRELGLLASGAELFIGPSTGPTHVANGAGCPVIGFYPPILVQSARRWAPFMAAGKIFSPQTGCPQTYACAETACSHFNCMEQIAVSEVLQAIEAFWGQGE